jgi:hypothetical protein
MTRRTGIDRRSNKRQRAFERRTGEDRRESRRIPLSLDVAVPVVVRGPDGVQRGLARNISEGGMLVEMEELPALGQRLEVTFAGINGSCSLTLFGEVRHHVGWQHSAQGSTQMMRGIGLRFIDGTAQSERLPAPGELLH